MNQSDTLFKLIQFRDHDPSAFLAARILAGDAFLDKLADTQPNSIKRLAKILEPVGWTKREIRQAVDELVDTGRARVAVNTYQEAEIYLQ